MKTEAYYYISVIYVSIAGLMFITLCVKGYYTYKKVRYVHKEDRLKIIKPIQYILHLLHIPPYLIAAYWYYDSYQEYTKIKDQTLSLT